MHGRKTRETKYLDAAKDIWGYIKEYVAIDKREKSEWFSVCVNADEARSMSGVEPWKYRITMAVCVWK